MRDLTGVTVTLPLPASPPAASPNSRLFLLLLMLMLLPTVMTNDCNKLEILSSRIDMQTDAEPAIRGLCADTVCTHDALYRAHRVIHKAGC